jgi:hypothetical protein
MIDQLEAGPTEIIGGAVSRPNYAHPVIHASGNKCPV